MASKQENDKLKITGKNLRPFFGALKDEPYISLEMIESNRQEINQKLKKRFGWSQKDKKGEAIVWFLI